MAQLALVRHGQSEWNARNLFTGWVNEPLTDLGVTEARQAAEKLRGTTWNVIFESDLLRAKQTTEEIRQTLQLTVPIVTSEALRERNYGIYTERNKDEVREELGEDEFEKLHRSWDYPIAGGESLKQVYQRVVPYFESEILPRLKAGENVIISAHGNSLRALSKYLKPLSDQEIETFEIPTGGCILLLFPP
ncbi:2,3-bisphosphoglycerate-dependent phosphoglycerate mutase, partial [Candidatus Microgenomates bacterium]|nr:2,3-bisphosphoglycerate-dependent phosphoglycerate mutase [Candidatus Microgenomates bacterium]